MRQRCTSSGTPAGRDSHDPAKLGHFALILALALALVQGALPLVGAARGHAGWIALARPAARAQFVFVAIAYAALTHAFVANDFSVLYVAAALQLAAAAGLPRHRGLGRARGLDPAVGR